LRSPPSPYHTNQKQKEKQKEKQPRKTTEKNNRENPPPIKATG